MLEHALARTPPCTSSSSGAYDGRERSLMCERSGCHTRPNGHALHTPKCLPCLCFAFALPCLALSCPLPVRSPFHTWCFSAILSNGQERSFSQGMQAGAGGLHTHLAHEAGRAVHGGVPADPCPQELPRDVQDTGACHRSDSSADTALRSRRCNHLSDILLPLEKMGVGPLLRGTLKARRSEPRCVPGRTWRN